jgi:DNA-binding GntR family transcriptional regulator
MRKFTIILFLFSFVNSFAQTEKLTTEIFQDILKNTYKYSTPKIVNKLDSLSVEFHLRKLTEKKDRLFFTEIDESKDSIHGIKLTQIEKEHLIKSIRKQYKHEWKKTDFKEYEIITSDESINYLKANEKNTLVEISNPIYLRNNEIAFVFFSNFCCGKYGHTNLSFYKKENGFWKIWVNISSVDF